jgi:hypothetical protein
LPLLLILLYRLLLLQLVFFLPQLVQLLRGDDDGAIQSFFLTAAAHSDLFAHQLIWALNSEAKPPEEAFNPEVKRWAFVILLCVSFLGVIIPWCNMLHWQLPTLLSHIWKGMH